MGHDRKAHGMTRAGGEYPTTFMLHTQCSGRGELTCDSRNIVVSLRCFVRSWRLSGVFLRMVGIVMGSIVFVPHPATSCRNRTMHDRFHRVACSRFDMGTMNHRYLDSLSRRWTPV